MGKKKSMPQNHVQQSMGQMVSKAALAQMGPAIDQTIRQAIQQLGSQLATQSASTFEMLFSRILVLEEVLMDKFQLTAEDFANMISDNEDKREGLVKVESPIEKGDTVRLEVATRTKDQTEFQGQSKLKVQNTGSGQNMGPDLEAAIIGMSLGETKEVNFGKDGEMVAKLSINRISRAVGVSNESSSQG